MWKVATLRIPGFPLKNLPTAASSTSIVTCHVILTGSDMDCDVSRSSRAGDWASKYSFIHNISIT